MLYKSFAPSVLGLKRNDIAEQLKGLGLTSYEARCYVSLASMGQSDPRRVAEEAGIPYQSAYTALSGLEAKGWVELVVKRPASYRAKKPETIKAMVDSKVDDVFESLGKLYKTGPTEDAELVYTLRGEDKVKAKVYELLRDARASLVIAAPTIGLEDAKLMELLAEMPLRGVRVRAIADDASAGLLPPGAEVRTANLVSVDLLVDDKVALISLPDYSACGWIESPAVAGHFKQFLELLWSTSSPAEP